MVGEVEVFVGAAMEEVRGGRIVALPAAVPPGLLDG